MMEKQLSSVWYCRALAKTLPGVPRGISRTREREALGRAIRVLRAERAVSQEDVERAGGLGQNALTRIERGSSSASFDSLVAIADGLGISLGELVAAYEAQLARAPR
jgi:DNA-binding Xre family transcriptional regulator